MTKSKDLVEYIEKTDSCWIWKGSKSKTGAGRVSVYVGDMRKQTSAPRVVWTLERKEKVPSNKRLIPICDNPSCVNPDHFKLVGWEPKLYLCDYCYLEYPAQDLSTAYSEKYVCKKCAGES